MKKLIVIVFMLVSVFSLQAQDSIARLELVIEYQPLDGDFVSVGRYEYEYNYQDELDFVRIRDYHGEPVGFYNYSGDTINSLQSFVYIHYTPNTVYMVQDGDTIEKFDVNSNNEWLHDGEYVWDKGNLVEWKRFFTATYQDFRNPYSHTNMYFKSHNVYPAIGGFKSINGSYNLVDTYHFDDNEFSWLVTDSIGKWPTDIHVFRNGNLKRRFTFEYHDWRLMDLNSAVEENLSGHHTVLSVDYFDLYGRKIPKPTQGFYIEIKSTDKGVMSKKYFIQ